MRGGSRSYASLGLGVRPPGLSPGLSGSGLGLETGGASVRPTRFVRKATLALVLCTGIGLALGARDAQADPHDPERSGHPLRVVAYTLHPIGVIADTLVFRPAHWIVHRHSFFEYLFGHQR